jgi:hypothetical protein
MSLRCQMKSTAIAIALLLVTAGGAHAGLRAYPEITSVELHPGDPERILIRVTWLPCEAAISTNGGAAFVALTEQDLPLAWSTNLTSGARRYVLVDNYALFRSDDSGVTWTNTGATSFLHEQNKAAIEQEENWFRQEYGSRLPPRSVLWHPLFALYALGYFTSTVFVLREAGVLRALLTALGGLVVLLLAWSLLWGVHAVVTHWTSSQYPMAYWNTSMGMHPSPKLGIAMAVAALPLPLLAYLGALWPVLPGSKEVLARAFAWKARRTALVVSVAAGTVFVVLHLGMMFIGSFWE